MTTAWRARVLAACLVAAAALPGPGRAAAQVRTTLIPLGQGAQGLLYEPVEPGPKAHVAIVQLHPYSISLGHVSCNALASRGYSILCGDTRFTNDQDGYGGYEDHAPAIRAAMEAVRRQPGVTKVILIGHSMGAPMMAFYQDVAEKGPGICQQPQRIMPCDPSSLAGLPAADGLILLDPHLGDAAATLTYVDPAISDAAAPARRERHLDMFAPENGFDAATNRASYSDSFKATYLEAQARRNQSLVADAQKLLAASAGDGGRYQDDMPFIVFGGNAARLFQPDIALMQHTRQAYTLLKADGTRPRQVLVSVRVPSGRARDALSFSGSVLSTTVRKFLAGRAIRTRPGYDMTADDLTGIDWESSNTSTPANIEGVSVPLLIMTMTGHYFLRPSEIILEHAASADKELVGLEGAAHGIVPCVPCASTPGAFGDTVKTGYDYIDGWIASRF